MRRERYDVVVIGSGIGGMCAGALLAHAGYKTLVVEKLALLGGRCSTMEYKGFKIATGLFTLLTYGGPMDSIWKEVGAEYDVRTTPPELPMTCYRIRGKDYPMPKEGLKGACSIAAKKERDVEVLWGAIQRGLMWQEPSARISMRDWILQYTHDDGILGVLQVTGIVHAIEPMELVPAVQFIRYLGMPYVLRSRGYPPRGWLAVIESLAESIRRNGGEVWTRCPAKRIIVEDQVVKAVGVKKEGEQVEIAAKVVISNASPRKTVELAGSENFDKGYLNEVRESPLYPPLTVFFFSTPTEKPLMEHPRLYLPEAKRINAIRNLTAVCPELAPPGRHLIQAEAHLSMLRPIDFKQEIHLSLQELREILPGFDKYAEILMVRCFHGDYPAAQAIKGYDLPQKTPVENLYNVGDGVKTSGFIASEACGVSARIVVEDVKKRIEPKNR